MDLYKIMLFVSFLFLSTLLNTSLHAINYYEPNTQTLTIDGKAKLGKNKQLAKDNAIKDAFTIALTKSIEGLIAKEKFDLHFETINQKILDKSSKFIKRFIIKDQGIKGDTYEVKVDLNIDEQKLKKELASIGLLFTGQDYYKGILLISLKWTNESSPDFWWGKKKLQERTQKVITEILAMKNLTNPILLLDPFELELNHKLPRNLRKLHLSTSEAHVAGKILNVDLVFWGTLSVSGNTISDNRTQLKITSSIQALNVHTGRIISHTNFSGETTANHKFIPSVENKLFLQALKNNLSKTTKNVISTWVNGTFNSMVHNLVIDGILNYSEFIQLKIYLKDVITSISSVHDRLLSKKRKIFTIETNKSLDEVKKEILNNRAETFQLELKEPDKLEFIFKRL